MSIYITNTVNPTKQCKSTEQRQSTIQYNINLYITNTVNPTKQCKSTKQRRYKTMYVNLQKQA